MLKRIAISATVLALALTACSVDDEPAVVKDRAADVQSESTSESPTAPEEEPSAEETSEAAPEPQAPKVGDLLEVGDWDVRITKVELNANAAIKDANQFNEDPKGVYVLATYKATYTGSDRTADSLFDLTWSFTTTDNQVNESAYAVTPMSEAPTEARKGGTITNQVVFDLPPKLVKGGTLTVETFDEDFDTVYGDIVVG